MKLLLILGSLLWLPSLYSQALKDQASLDKGKKLYMSNCIQCHNKDPNKKGPLGPEQVDTPYEVFQVKVISGRYPEKFPKGYIPKRKTKAMRPFPKLKDDVKYIYSWIQSVKVKK